LFVALVIFVLKAKNVVLRRMSWSMTSGNSVRILVPIGTINSLAAFFMVIGLHFFVAWPNNVS
jgi:hypothetical protein